MKSIEAIVFTADCTVGKLSKWLRILGFDARFEAGGAAGRGGGAGPKRCVLLTRIQRLGEMREGAEVFVVRSERPFDQLKEVVTAFGLEPHDLRPFSRCIRCNMPVVEVDREKVRGRVPDYVWASHSAFHACEGCGRIYWPGSHTERTLQIIKDIFSVKKESTS